MEQRSVVITGVATGIGHATARLLVARGFHVFGSVRRPESAAPLQQALGAAFTPLHFDVTDAASVHAAAALVGQALGGGRLAGLVNNAGIAVGGPLEHLPLADLRRQLEVNLVGPLAVTQAFLPLLGADPARTGPPGRIVMVSSLTALVSVPFLGPYAAAKRALEGLSEALRRELMVHGIDVVVVGPGTVATPIWDKAEQTDFTAYERTVYASAFTRMRALAVRLGRKGDPPERTAQVIHAALTASRPRVRYAPVAGRFVNSTLPRLLPKRLVDRLFAKMFGLTRRA